MFNSLDTNGDGKVDQSERNAAMNKAQSHHGTNNSNMKSALDQAFKDGDSDGDSALSKDEFTKMASNMRPPAGGAPGASGGASGGNSTLTATQQGKVQQYQLASMLLDSSLTQESGTSSSQNLSINWQGNAWA